MSAAAFTSSASASFSRVARFKPKTAWSPSFHTLGYGGSITPTGFDLYTRTRAMTTKTTPTSASANPTNKIAVSIISLQLRLEPYAIPDIRATTTS